MTDTDRPAAALERYLDIEGMGDPRRFGFAHAVRAGDLLYLAGFLGIDENFRPVGDGFTEQAETMFDNLLRVLGAAGLGPDALVSMTLYLTDMSDSGALFEIRKAKLGPVFAASAAIGVSELVLPELKVEVQAVALATTPATSAHGR